MAVVQAAHTRHTPTEQQVILAVFNEHFSA